MKAWLSPASSAKVVHFSLTKQEGISGSADRWVRGWSGGVSYKERKASDVTGGKAKKRTSMVRGTAYCSSTASLTPLRPRCQPSAQSSCGVVCLSRSASTSPTSGVKQIAVIGQTIRKAIWE